MMLNRNLLQTIPNSIRDCTIVTHDRVDEMNRKLIQRSELGTGPMLYPELDIRPQHTKYTQFHMFDVRTPQTTTSTGTSTFHPSSQRGQPAQFRNTVDIETQIQNRGLNPQLSRTDPRQRSQYFPDVNGSLYRPNTFTSYPGKPPPTFTSAGYAFEKQQFYEQIVSQAPRGSNTVRLFNLDSHTR